LLLKPAEAALLLKPEAALLLKPEVALPLKPEALREVAETKAMGLRSNWRQLGGEGGGGG
jgi:hypothetical protein